MYVALVSTTKPIAIQICNASFATEGGNPEDCSIRAKEVDLPSAPPSKTRASCTASKGLTGKSKCEVEAERSVEGSDKAGADAEEAGGVAGC